MRDLPLHLKWTYMVLYWLAWAHDYQWSDETLRQLAQTFTEQLGDDIEPRGVRQRLDDLKEHGLIERRQVGGRYRTYLKVRHTGDAPNGTAESKGDALERHPNSINYVVVESETENQNQQQQLVNKGDVDAKENERLLREMGLVGSVVGRFAREKHVTPEYLNRIEAYREQQAAKGNVLGTGWLVKFIGGGHEPPEVLPERYRYVMGKYKDYIKH